MSDKYEKEAAMLLGVYKLDGLQVSLLAANIQRIVAEETEHLRDKIESLLSERNQLEEMVLSQKMKIATLEASCARMRDALKDAHSYFSAVEGSESENIIHDLKEHCRKALDAGEKPCQEKSNG